MHYSMLSSSFPSVSQIALSGSFQLHLETMLFFTGQNVLPCIRDTSSLPTSMSNTTHFCRRPRHLQAHYNYIYIYLNLYFSNGKQQTIYFSVRRVLKYSCEFWWEHPAHLNGADQPQQRRRGHHGTQRVWLSEN